MFYKNRKYTGQIFFYIAIILIVLLLFNNKLILNFDNKNNKKEAFSSTVDIVSSGDGTNTTVGVVGSNGSSLSTDESSDVNCQLKSNEIDVQINSKKRSLTVSFYNVEECMSKSNFKGYSLVLVKYNSNLKKIGHLEVKVLGQISGILDAKKNNLRDINGNQLEDITITNLISKIQNNQSISNDTLLKALKINIEEKFHYDTGSSSDGLQDAYNIILQFANNKNQGDVFPKFNDFIEIDIESENTVDTNAKDNLLIDTIKNELELYQMNKFNKFNDYLTTDNNNSNTYLNKLDFNTIIIDLLYFLSNLESIKNKYCNPNTNLCQYEFTNLEITDDQNNDIFYKLGFKSIVDGSNLNPYITYYVTKNVPYFKLTEPLNLQRELHETSNILAGLKNKPIIKQTNEEDIEKTDLELYMKQFLGNYPNELKLKNEEMKELTLQNYIGESLAKGEINANINIDKNLSKTNLF